MERGAKLGGQRELRRLELSGEGCEVGCEGGVQWEEEEEEEVVAVVEAEEEE